MATTRPNLLLAMLVLLILSSCKGELPPTEIKATASIVASPVISTTVPTETPQPKGNSIPEIQGAGHISPLKGQNVQNVRGVVTAIRADGFYLQSIQPDSNVGTSDAILVFTLSSPIVKIGDEVLVSGVVDEYYPGGTATGNLSITEIITPVVSVISKNMTLPNPIILGQGGRIPPSEVIENDRFEVFDPESDGLDFYESLESMLVQVNNAVVVGPTNAYKEIVLLADGGANSGIRSPRGGIVIRDGDFNPERIMIDDLLTILPDVNVGDRFENAMIGVMDYNFGGFRILVKQRPTVISGGLKPQVIEQGQNDEFSISAFNVQNLDPSDGQKKFNDLANVLVNNLKSPDIVSLEEIQDNNGAIDGVVVDASETYRLIIQAIQAAGGPKYEYVDISPEPNQDGGEVGGNIRVGFIYRTDRGITFNRVAGGTATTAVDVKLGSKGIELSFNPGRIEPGDSAFLSSRKPLIAEFDVRGSKIFIIGLHLNSKGGDTAIYGRYQPPILTSETQRMQQATVLNQFVTKLLGLDPKAKLIILGDLNDFQFSRPVVKLLNANLIDLFNTLPAESRYSYIYEGNGQVLDHIVISPALKENLKFFDAVHINSEFAVARRLSDHDPTYARFKLP